MDVLKKQKNIFRSVLEWQKIGTNSQLSLTMSFGILSVSNCGFIPNASTICLIRSARKSMNIRLSPSKNIMIIPLNTTENFMHEVGQSSYIYNLQVTCSLDTLYTTFRIYNYRFEKFICLTIIPLSFITLLYDLQEQRVLLTNWCSTLGHQIMWIHAKLVWQLYYSYMH